MATTFKQHKNNAISTLDTGIDDNDLTIEVAAGDGSLFPSGPCWITIFDDDVTLGEIVLVDSRTTDTFTVNASGRGAQNTIAQSWTSGVNVQLLMTAGALDQLQDAVNDIEDGTTTLTTVTASGAISGLSVTATNALTGASAVIGGGYGSSGATISSAGVIEANGAITTDGALTADSAVIGGGYGSSGCTISNAGAVSANGNLIIGGTSTLTGAVSCSDDITIDNFLKLTRGSATIASGAITATSSWMQLDTEASAASDDLDTINGGEAGALLILRTSSSSRDVVVRHLGGGTGNIRLNGAVDYTIPNTSSRLTLMYDDNLSLWVEVARSTN
jgi:hypothetical protein